MVIVGSAKNSKGVMVYSHEAIPRKGYAPKSDYVPSNGSGIAYAAAPLSQEIRITPPSTLEEKVDSPEQVA